MNVLKSFFANSAQIAKLIVLVAATLTGLHWLPSITPLLGPLSDAIAAHDYTAIFGDALAIFAAAVALFQGHVEIERHEEKLAMMAMQAQPNMPVASTVRAMRHACKVA